MVAVETILVAGGGIGGLAVAIALIERGFDVELVEKGTTWSPSGAGLSVQANGMRVLRALGVAADVETAGARLHRMAIATPEGERLCALDFDDLWRPVGPSVGIARAALHRALVERAASRMLRHRLGTSVASVTASSNSVDVAFSDGSRRRYGLVIGADGIASDVRNALGGPRVEYLGQVVWRTVVPARPASLDGVTFVAGGDRFFGMCPVDDRRTYVFGNLASPRTRDGTGDGRAARFREAFAAFAGDVPMLLDALGDDASVHFSPVEHLEAPAWGSPRVILLGDAAHASSPMLGQGGSMALEDALVLAEELATRATIEDAVAAYVHRRAPRIEWIRSEGRAAAQAMALSPGVRDSLLRTRGAEILRARYVPLLAPP